MRINPLPPVDYLRQRLRYEPDTGKIYWRDYASMPKSWRARYAGREALTYVKPSGHQMGRIDRKAYQAHRIAWALHHGEDPAGEIDHINHDPLDNRIENLRVVSHQENHRNTSLRKNNTSGAMGVSWFAASRKWSAYLMVDGRKKHLGYFHDHGDAVAARRAAEARYGFHTNHGVEATVNLLED
jgi:hypothetical protein